MTWPGQEKQAETFDDFVAGFDELLKRLEDAAAMCEVLGEQKLLTETHGYAGGVRALRNDLQNRARDLRRHQDVDVLPMSLTTRNVRPG
jgi:hypothetical protein